MIKKVTHASLPNIKEKNLVFLSPHPDDIALTFGGLVLANKGFKKHLIHYSVFFGTSNWTDNELNIKTDHRIEYVTVTRFAENRLALNRMFGGWQNYHFTFQPFWDSLLRDYAGPPTAGGGPGGDFSTFRPIEKKTFQDIVALVKPIVAQKDTAIFILLAIGSHIDHFILREAVITAAYELGDQAHAQIYLGEDQPYTGSLANTKVTVATIKQLTKRLGLQPLTYPIKIQEKVDLFQEIYFSQYSPDYIVGLKNRAKQLNGGERIYLWPKENYKKTPSDPSCKQSYCKLAT
ncbi:MAG: hypothetical protein EXR81_02170 [Gammaproteobacteria bacterium]|nr:hypothetical protein [Gammaproteobacteria bacterium]